MARGDSPVLRYKIWVRYYWYSRMKRRVLSPNVDLRAGLPKIIARPVYDGFRGEPMEIASAEDLRNDHENDSKPRQEAADGVYISPRVPADDFPLWPCLAQSDRCPKEEEVFVVNLYEHESLPVPIKNICWVPGYEADNGDLYTVISSPGKEGYRKAERLPVMVQRQGHPEHTKRQLLALSELSTLKQVSHSEREKFLELQAAFIRRQYLLQPRPLPSPVRKWRRHIESTHRQSISDTPDFMNSSSNSPTSDEEKTSSPVAEHCCSDDPEDTEKHSSENLCQCLCPYSDIGMTVKNPLPLHWHIPDSRCVLGSAHSEHCIFAKQRPSHCVISSSNEDHQHCRILNEDCDATNELHFPHVADQDEMIRDSSVFPDLENIANEGLLEEDSSVHRASPPLPALSPDRPSIEIYHAGSSPTTSSVDANLEDCANEELLSFPEPGRDFRNLGIYHNAYSTPEPREFQV
ncbi:hypothetical protein F5Y18DRAFT_197458 [Xylariaceae sp. FL1019]|nr:hypothetical protein F5Y18DRAFT_197458 [Xylariaceae sp. FL1019]